MIVEYGSSMRIPSFLNLDLENGIRFVIDVSCAQPIVELRRGRKTLIDFRYFIPGGTQFEWKGVASRWEASVRVGGWGQVAGKTIRIGSLSGAESVLRLLHEMGHLNRADSFLDFFRLEMKYFKTLERLKHYSSADAKIIKEFNELKTASERDAWAFSLRTVRLLERTYGINILDRLSGEGSRLEKVRDLMRMHLSSYEDSYFEDMKKIEFVRRMEENNQG